jgi:hypothetical protein
MKCGLPPAPPSFQFWHTPFDDVHCTSALLALLYISDASRHRRDTSRSTDRLQYLPLPVTGFNTLEPEARYCTALSRLLTTSRPRVCPRTILSDPRFFLFPSPH